MAVAAMTAAAAVRSKPNRLCTKDNLEVRTYGLDGKSGTAAVFWAGMTVAAASNSSRYSSGYNSSGSSGTFSKAFGLLGTEYV